MKRFAFIAFVFLFATSLFAQVNATVGGTVADATGAVVPGIEVTAKNIDTGIVTTRVTNESGSYDFPSLQPGKYTISVMRTGFQTSTYNNVELGQGVQVRLNFTLQVNTQGQSVEVVAEADVALATTTASVGGVLAVNEVSNLPLATRNVFDLVQLTPGVISVAGAFGPTLAFAGTPSSQANTTRDGMVTNDGRYNDSNGSYSATFTSPDLVEEVRISTNSIDPSLGRGSAQVQMRTRSGGNEFHGALFYTNNNSAFNAQPYFNNLQGLPKDYKNRNQFGGRVGGPIKKNKAFFFFLTDDQRYVQKVNITNVVLTAPARQGIFRYLTSGGVGGASRRNGNALSTTPSVDLNGNTLTTAGGAPLFVNQFSLFTNVKDPNRPQIDPTWFGPQYLKRLPLPNNWTVGDGLNTAGVSFLRRDYGVDGATGQSTDPNRNNYTFKIDYQINDKHKVAFTFTKERDFGVTGQTGLANYPTAYQGDVQRTPKFMSGQFTSSISANLLNEFRFGYKSDTWLGTSAFDLGYWDGSPAASAVEATKSFPTVNGQFQYVAPGGSLGLLPYAEMNVSSPRRTISPLTQFGDNLTYLHGKHSFGVGFDVTRSNSQSANSGGAQTIRPSASLGVGAIPVPGITTANYPGINTSDITTAQDLLGNLAGTVASITQQYYVNSGSQKDWSNYAKDGFLFYRELHSNQWSGYVKDQWKVTRNFTLNLGVRYDFFGVPYETHGLGGRFVGGGAGLFGISGTDYASAFTNRYKSTGALSNTEFVGPNSPNPDATIFNNDRNNFAPSIGFSWNLPYFKKNTVIRGGYGVNYAGTYNLGFLNLNTNVGNIPGQTLNTTASISSYVNLSNLEASKLVPLSTGGTLPFQPVALTNRTAGTSAYDTNLRSPYIQTFNLQIQRELSRSLVIDFSYAGNKATKLLTTRQINDVDILDNGFLDAFNVTRAGGNAPLFDQLLGGLNVTGVGVVGTNGITGSSALRRFTTTNQFIANGQVGALANYVNNTANLAGLPGGLLRNGKFPENFIVVNPQFGSVGLVSNNGNSTYHSFTAHIQKRLTNGLTGQASYVFSKNLGDAAIRDQNNLRLSKTLLPNDRPHVIQEDVSYSLPFGKGAKYFTNAPGWLDQIVSGWNLASGANWSSGSPLTFTGLNTLNQFGTGTADLVGALPADYQQIVKIGNQVNYFPSLTTATVAQRPGILPNFGTGADAATLAGRFTNQVVVDSNGNVVIANSTPGRAGNTAINMAGLRGPGQLSFNGALGKAFKITERKTITLRADAVNLLNKPQWGNPNTNINGTSFGRVTTATGNRVITFNARFDF